MLGLATLGTPLTNFFVFCCSVDCLMFTHVGRCIRPQGRHGANLTMKVSRGTEPSLAPAAARTGSPHGLPRPGAGPGAGPWSRTED